jgi:hypothetical protein
MSSPMFANTPWRATKSQIGALCQNYGLLLQAIPSDIDPVQLMWAIALNESIHETNGILYFPPRHEPAYDQGGRYCVGEQASACVVFGRDAACSYGPWQVMFCHAKGYSPKELGDTEKCAEVFLSYMNRELNRQKPKTIDQIGDMYNSGNFRDGNVPKEYIARLRHHYYTDILGTSVEGNYLLDDEGGCQ